MPLYSPMYYDDQLINRRKRLYEWLTLSTHLYFVQCHISYDKNIALLTRITSIIQNSCSLSYHYYCSSPVRTTPVQNRARCMARRHYSGVDCHTDVGDVPPPDHSSSNTRPMQTIRPSPRPLLAAGHLRGTVANAKLHNAILYIILKGAICFELHVLY